MQNEKIITGRNKKKFGHDTGDEYILLCATILKNAVRNTDYIFRMGDDEFLVIIPNATDVIAKKVIDTIHEKIADDRMYQNKHKN